MNGHKNKDTNSVTLYIDDSDQFDEVLLKLRYAIDLARRNILRLERLLIDQRLIRPQNFNISNTTPRELVRTEIAETSNNMNNFRWIKVVGDSRSETVVAEINKKSMLVGAIPLEHYSTRTYVAKREELNELKKYYTANTLDKIEEEDDEEEKEEAQLLSIACPIGEKEPTAITAGRAIKAVEEISDEMISIEMPLPETPNISLSDEIPPELPIRQIRPTAEIPPPVPPHYTRSVVNSGSHRSLSSLLQNHRRVLEEDMHDCDASFCEICAISFLTAALITSIAFIIFLMFFYDYDIHITW